MSAMYKVLDYARYRMLCFYLLSAAIACVDIQGPAPKPLAPSEILSQLQFSTRAVMMSVSDTVSLSVSTIYMDGSQSLIPADSINWSSQDSAQVYIDTTGVVTALKESNIPVGVIASYKRSGTTKSDTIPVYVTANQLDADRIMLVSIDSSSVGANPPAENPRIRVDLYHGQALVMKGAIVPLTVPEPVTVTYLSSGGPDGEPVYAVGNNRGYLGPFWVKGSVLLYNTEVKDSVLYQGVYPATGPMILIQSTGDGGVHSMEMLPDDPVPNIQPCGWVLVIATGIPDRQLDVVFSDSLSLENECNDIPLTLLNEFRVLGAVPIFDNIVGGNLKSVKPTGPLPFTLWIRRSGSEGEISYFVRDAVTGDSLPVSGRYRQVAVK